MVAIQVTVIIVHLFLNYISHYRQQLSILKSFPTWANTQDQGIQNTFKKYIHKNGIPGTQSKKLMPLGSSFRKLPLKWPDRKSPSNLYHTPAQTFWLGSMRLCLSPSLLILKFHSHFGTSNNQSFLTCLTQPKHHVFSSLTDSYLSQYGSLAQPAANSDICVAL